MDIDDVKNSIVATVRDRARDLLDRNASAAAFLEICARDLAKLAVRLIQVSDDRERETVLGEIAFARQAAENEIVGLALEAETEARRTFKEIVGTVFSFVEKALPTLLRVV